MTRWIAVCESTVQPAVGLGNSMGCSQAGGTLLIMPVDTVITESSPLLNLGQLLAMTPEDASVIAWQICAVWAIAWGIKQLCLFLLENDNVQNDS